MPTNSPALPDEANAAIELLAAFEAVPEVAEDSAWKRLSDTYNPPHLEGEPEPVRREDEPLTPWSVVSQAMADHAAAFAALDGIDAKLRPAVDFFQADFGIDYANPQDGVFINILLPDLSEARDLANLLAWQMLLQTHEKRHDEVAQTARRIIGLGEAVDAGHPILVGHLVDVGIQALAADRIGRVCRT